MSKNLQEAIENVGMVNNVDGQNFDKDFVGTAPVSYADAVLRMRAKREKAKKGCDEHTKAAMETLKKEVSNAEHPEPLDKVKVSDDGKITLNEALFESFDDEHLGHNDDVCPVCGKDPCECKVKESCLKEASNHIIPGENRRKVIIVEDEASIECILNTFTNTTSNVRGGGSTYYSVVFKVISDSISPAFSVYFWDVDKQNEFYESVPKKFDTVKQFIDYLTDIYNSYERTDADYNIRNIARKLEHSDVNEDIKNTEQTEVFRVDYMHSPEIFSSVMIKASSEDEARKKFKVKYPNKEIIAVTSMTQSEVDDMKRRGMSLLEAKIIDAFDAYVPWGAAVSTFDNIQNAGKMDALEQLIDDMYPDGIDRTELNDLLAFESDWVYSMLDMSSEGDIDEEEEEDGPAIDFEEEEE